MASTLWSWLSQATITFRRDVACSPGNMVKKAKQTNDPLLADCVSIEMGYSTYNGSSKLQMDAYLKGVPFELRATKKADGVMGCLAEQAARIAWEVVERRYPAIAAEMLKEVGEWGIYGTGFSKVTIAFDNPTTGTAHSNQPDTHPTTSDGAAFECVRGSSL
jgi:hypothetical protein